ncbi:MAG TPA: hypothetical protein VGL93_14075 [Streptosporangiaceae bacterium]|jgi:hypothetical protein
MGDGMERVLSKAMSWVEDNLGTFVPRAESWTAGPLVRNLGPLLDLAITCHLLRRREVPVLVPADKILDGVAELFLAESYQRAFLGIAERFPYYLWLLAILGDSGRLPDPRLTTTAQALVDRGYGTVADLDRPAHKQLELRYILDLGGFASPLPSMRELRRRNPIETLTDPVPVAEPDVYALTHAIFFASDFATEPIPDLTPQGNAAVNALLGVHAVSGYRDLAAELILCRRALGRPENDLDRLGRACLARAQLASGAVPGPRFDAAEAAALPPGDRDAYAFDRCYHTTLATIVCAGADWPLR